MNALMFLALTGISIGLMSSASAAPKCQSKALQQLKSLDPHGYNIYLQEKESFLSSAWWSCEDFVSDTDTAVHESVHMLTSDRQAYPLIGGALITLIPNTDEFFPPSEIGDQVDPKLNLAFYVIDNKNEEQPSSVHYLRYLFDEMNAYSHGLYTTNRMLSLKQQQDDAIDGAMGMMYFFSLYAQRALTAHPETWAALNAEPTRSTIQKLWLQAETVSKEGCRLNTTGGQDRYYEERLCANTGHEAVEALLGRHISCPQVCLNTPGRFNQDDSAEVQTDQDQGGTNDGEDQ